MKASGRWMSRWGVQLALAMVLASQAAWAQAARPRVVLLEFEGDRRDAVRTQLENALNKNKQVELVALRQYTNTAKKAGLKGPAPLTPEGVAQVAPRLELAAVVTGKVGRSLLLQVWGPDGRELWTKSVKLQRGKLPASDVRRLAAGIATTAEKPPPSVKPPPEQPTEPPAATPPTPTPTPEPSPAPVAATPPADTAKPPQPEPAP